MALLPLLMRRHPCHHQDGVVYLVTIALPPLIVNGVAALIVSALLPSSSWHCCPCCNGIVVMIDVIALAACQQAGIAAVDAQVSLLLLQWQLLHSSLWSHRCC
jgi:hypothetical protein